LTPTAHDHIGQVTVFHGKLLEPLKVVKADWGSLPRSLIFGMKDEARANVVLENRLNGLANVPLTFWSVATKRQHPSPVRMVRNPPQNLPDLVTNLSALNEGE
jgi:hypothetical protein